MMGGSDEGHHDMDAGLLTSVAGHRPTSSLYSPLAVPGVTFVLEWAREDRDHEG